MKLRCKCGQEFESQASKAKCPKCGQMAEAGVDSTWIDTLSMDELVLEAKPEAPAPAAPAQAPAAPSGDELSIEGAAAAQPQAAPTPRRTAPAPSRAGTRTATSVTMSKAPAAPPKGPLDVLRAFSRDPKEPIQFFVDGVKDKNFMIRVAVPVAVLAIVPALVHGYLKMAPNFQTTVAVKDLLGVIFDSAAACFMLSLVSIGFKRQAKPLGVSELVMVGRIPSLLFTAAVSVIAGVVGFMMVKNDNIAGARALAKWVWLAYLPLNFAFQAYVSVSLMRLGCAGGLGLSLAVTYGTYVLAQTVVKAFGA